MGSEWEKESENYKLLNLSAFGYPVKALVDIKIRVSVLNESTPTKALSTTFSKVLILQSSSLKPVE